METEIFPFSVFINVGIVKFWLKILKSCDAKLISAAYAQMMQDPDKYAWVKYTGKISSIQAALTQETYCAPLILGMFREINLG